MLCVVVCVLWVRSHQSRHCWIRYSGTAGADESLVLNTAGVVTGPGRLAAYRVTQHFPGRYVRRRPDLLAYLGDAKTLREVTPLPENRRWSPFGDPNGWSQGPGVAGFQWMTTLPNWERTTGGRCLAVPFWFVALLTAIPPAIAARRAVVAIVGRRRRKRGRCSRCGYDLRAHAKGGRCPECSTGMA